MKRDLIVWHNPHNRLREPVTQHRFPRDNNAGARVLRNARAHRDYFARWKHESKIKGWFAGGVRGARCFKRRFARIGVHAPNAHRGSSGIYPRDKSLHNKRIVAGMRHAGNKGGAGDPSPDAPKRNESFVYDAGDNLVQFVN